MIGIVAQSVVSRPMNLLSVELCMISFWSCNAQRIGQPAYLSRLCPRIQFRMVPIAFKIGIDINIKRRSSWFVDHSLVLGAFEVPTQPLDCISMGLLWFSREVGTLMCGIGDVRSSALFEIVELANDVPVVKTLIMLSGIIVASK